MEWISIGDENILFYLIYKYATSPHWLQAWGFIFYFIETKNYRSAIFFFVLEPYFK